MPGTRIGLLINGVAIYLHKTGNLITILQLFSICFPAGFPNQLFFVFLCKYRDE